MLRPLMLAPLRAGFCCVAGASSLPWEHEVEKDRYMVCELLAWRAIAREARVIMQEADIGKSVVLYQDH